MLADLGIVVILHLVGGDAEAEQVETLILERLAWLTDELQREIVRGQVLLVGRGLDKTRPRYTHPVTATVHADLTPLAPWSWSDGNGWLGVVSGRALRVGCLLAGLAAGADSLVRSRLVAGRRLPASSRGDRSWRRKTVLIDLTASRIGEDTQKRPRVGL